MRVRAAAAAMAVAGVLGSAEPVSAASGPAIEGPFGAGAAAVWLLRPKGPVRAVVVFGHGWKQQPPSIAHPWVGQFRPWLDHLVATGNAVVFPRYQLGGDRPGVARVDAYRRGLQLAFARLGMSSVPVIAAGYSYGGTLAFYYAANAERWGLPPAAAVDAVFPAGMIPGATLPPLPDKVQVLIQVGDRDAEAGRGGADSFWAWLAHHPRKRKWYRIIVSTPELSATHAAPKETTAAARRSFWAPLDALILAARGPGG